MRLHLFWQVNGHNVVHACMQSNKVGFSLPSSLKQNAAILRRGIKLPTLRTDSGVLVAARAINSNVDVALEAGDVIHTMNGTAVKTGEALRAALNHTNANSPVVLQIERSGKLMFIAFKLDNPN